MRISRTHLAVSASMAGWLALCGTIFGLRDGAITADAIADARDTARDGARAAADLVRIELRDLAGKTRVLASVDDVATALERAITLGLNAVPAEERARRLMAEPDVESLNRAFEAAGEHLALDAVFLLDHEGRLVASGDWRNVASGAFGTAFRHRAYFVDAMESEEGVQFAVGTLSREPGLFYAVAVRGPDGPRGVLVTKGRPATVIGSLPQSAAVILVTNADDVVVLGSVAGYSMLQLKADGRRDPARSLLETYGVDTLPSLAVAEADDGLYAVSCSCPMDEATVAWHTEDLDVAGWSTHAMAPLDGLPSARETNALIGGLVGLVGLLLCGAVAWAVAYVRAVRRQAIRDPLSGAYNRAYLEEIVPRQFAQHDRGTVDAIALAVFDIDHFKQINDRFGHAAGDRAIRAVAQLLVHEARQADVAFRVGGDEFAVLLVGADATGGKDFAERIRQRVEASANARGLDPGVVTVSCGVAARAPGETFDSLLQRADERLYAVKSAGRNGVAVADEPDASPSASV